MTHMFMSLGMVLVVMPAAAVVAVGAASMAVVHI